MEKSFKKKKKELELIPETESIYEDTLEGSVSTKKNSNRNINYVKTFSKEDLNYINTNNKNPFLLKNFPQDYMNKNFLKIKTTENQISSEIKKIINEDICKNKTKRANSYSHGIFFDINKKRKFKNLWFFENDKFENRKKSSNLIKTKILNLEDCMNFLKNEVSDIRKNIDNSKNITSESKKKLVKNKNFFNKKKSSSKLKKKIDYSIKRKSKFKLDKNLVFSNLKKSNIKSHKNSDFLNYKRKSIKISKLSLLSESLKRKTEIKTKRIIGKIKNKIDFKSVYESTKNLFCKKKKISILHKNYSLTSLSKKVFDKKINLALQKNDEFKTKKRINLSDIYKLNFHKYKNLRLSRH